jgi:hypothetical protein
MESDFKYDIHIIDEFDYKTSFEEISKFVKNSEKFDTENTIEITEYSYDVYYAFLKYLYTDCIDIETEKAMDLLNLANNFKE